MKTFFSPRNILLAALLFSCFNMSAFTKRALLIGIDKYVATTTTPEVFAQRGKATNEREGWTNLDGCLNDAKSMRSIIQARYGFMSNNIDTLFNEQASRQGILDGIQKLINTSQRGDVVFIYYAGHGSQVRNSQSSDHTGLDQTIVPADLWDIRNKELSKLFNQLIDKGVTLTLIFDSCHSGAIARGNSLPVTFKERKAPPADWDANDPSKDPASEDRGALLFSAAQRAQTAKEASDQDGTPHGAFTLALTKAINSSPANQSAENLYSRVLGIIKSDGGPTFQDPILGGTPERKKAGIFNDKVSENSAKVFIAVLNVNETEVTLRGGHELSIYSGCRFIKVSGKDTFTLEVTSIERIGESKAVPVGKGKLSSFKSGDLVEMISWVKPDGPTLRIWAPNSTMTAAQIKKDIAPVNALMVNYYSKISDPTKKAPAYVIQFNDGKWMVTSTGSSSSTILPSLTEASIKAVIPKGSEVFLQIPPSKELRESLATKLGPGSPNSAIEFTKNPLEANYILIGRYENEMVEYALVRPNISDQDTSSRNSFPLRTSWCNYPVSVTSDSISTYAVRLGKINSWLTLAAPADNFPYYLALENSKRQVLKTGDKMDSTQTYYFTLKLDSANAPSSRIITRYIYIFTFDGAGNMTLFYPNANYGAESNVIKYIPGNAPGSIDLVLDNPTKGFGIGSPFGFDTYFLLTSDVAISPSAFQAKGVCFRGPVGVKSPLEDLLSNNGVTTRAPKQMPPVVTHWSIQKFQFQSVAKTK